MSITTHRVHVYGHSVSTDVIFPGKYTYTLRTKQEIAAHALEDLDPDFVKRVQPGDVIVAGRNWGMGSSREQAVTTLQYNGVNIIIAASFGGIFFRNCINQGVHPIVCPGVLEVVNTGDEIGIDREAGQIIVGATTLTFPQLSPSVRAIMQAGGLVPMLQAKFKSDS